jgi:hypothetical protein
MLFAVMGGSMQALMIESTVIVAFWKQYRRFQGSLAGRHGARSAWRV